MNENQTRLDRRKTLRTPNLRAQALPNLYSVAANEFALILVLAFSFLLFQLS